MFVVRRLGDLHALSGADTIDDLFEEIEALFGHSIALCMFGRGACRAKGMRMALSL